MSKIHESALNYEPFTKWRKMDEMTSSKVKFSIEDLQNYLFGYTNATEGSIQGQKILNRFEAPTSNEDLPNIVSFNISNVPGAGYGVQASQIIPEGAWIGPYKGRLVKPEDGIGVMDSSYLWEIFKDGKLQAYIDGNDELSSSWMRFIRCARHKQEQNLYAFQYRENIYYRAFKTINPGQELLVWYDDMYTQYLGIPCQGIYDMASSKGPTKFPGNLVVIAEDEAGLPATPPISPRSSPNGTPTESNPPGVSNRLQRKTSYGFSKAVPSSSSTLSRPPPLKSMAQSSNLEIQTKSVDNTKNDYMRSFPRATLPGGSLENDDATQMYFSPEKQHLSNSQSYNRQSSEQSQQSPTAFLSSSSPTDEPEQPIKCGQCKKEFTQRSMLNTHICSSQTAKPYQCGHCDERFSSPGEMTVHVAVHQDKKPFKCGYCSRSFTGATTLNNHVRMHTGEKPFDCYRCGKTFTKGLQLSKHQKIPGNCVPRKR